MIGFLSKIFGGNKSEKDVKKITPLVAKINAYFTEYQSLSNDQLRSKTTDFKDRIKKHLSALDEEISTKKDTAENLPVTNINEKDVIYQELDLLKKERDKQT
jgi:preprotein translocase subunit SecA